MVGDADLFRLEKPVQGGASGPLQALEVIETIDPDGEIDILGIVQELPVAARRDEGFQRPCHRTEQADRSHFGALGEGGGDREGGAAEPIMAPLGVAVVFGDPLLAGEPGHGTI